MDRESRAELAIFSKSLISLVKGLENQIITIDLRNEAMLTGKLINCDAFMNLEMKDVMFYDPKGSDSFFEKFHLHARLIRYVHLPKEADPEFLIKKALENKRKVYVTKNTRTLKKSRAEKYQKSILENLSKASTSS